MFRDLFLTYPTKMPVNTIWIPHIYCFRCLLKAHYMHMNINSSKMLLVIEKIGKLGFWEEQQISRILPFYQFITKLYSTKSKLRQKTFLGSQHVLMWIFITFQAVFVLGCQMLAEKSYVTFCNPTPWIDFKYFTQNINK